MANETKPEPKSVVLKAGEDVKHIISFGGFMGLYLRPSEPTAVPVDQYAKLQEDVGFKSLVKAGKIIVEK